MILKIGLALVHPKKCKNGIQKEIFFSLEYAECKTWITNHVCVILEIVTISCNMVDMHKVGRNFTLLFICDILHGGGVLYWTELHNNSVLMYISMQVHYKLPIIPL